MGKYDGASITINNWEKFNPRRDVKASSWFRLDHSIFDEPKFYDLEPVQWGVLLYILCEASKGNSGTIFINYKRAERVAQFNRSIIDSAIEKLLKTQFVTVDVTHTNADVTCTNVDVPRTCTTNVRTYERTKGKNFNFENQMQLATQNAVAVANAPSLPKVQIQTGKFIAAYIGAWQKKYGAKTRPDLSGKVQGQIKRFLADVPIDRACELIQVYFQIDDKWFATKCHDFTTFVENQNKIGLALDRGFDSGSINWAAVFGEEVSA